MIVLEFRTIITNPVPKFRTTWTFVVFRFLYHQWKFLGVIETGDSEVLLLYMANSVSNDMLYYG